MPSKDLEEPCVDCKSAEASLTIRKRQLCRECFLYYVNSKCLKRMESYRIRKSSSPKRRKLLLPISGGVSSTVLLSVLDQQLQRQRENSRGFTAYDLQVLLVYNSSTDASGPSADLLAKLKDAFPQHTHSLIPLEDIFAYDRDTTDVITDMGLSASLFRDLDNNLERLTTLLSSFSSRTATRDAEEVLLRRLVVAFAKSEGCESILWGDSDSRLASKVLANVAKGRGSSVPWLVCDGPSPFGINFNFPLRDLSKPELVQYSTLGPSNLKQLIASTTEPRASRNNSINDLMDQYIESQGEKYPSIMANVVRTVNKLQRPTSDTEIGACGLCGDPIKSCSALFEAGNTALCYGCSQLRLDSEAIII